MATTQTANPPILDQEQLEFAEQIKKQRKEKYNSTVKVCCMVLSIFSLTVFLLVAVSFLFVGLCKISNVNFSLVGLFFWLDKLPTLPISNPTAQITELVFGIFFLIFYVILTVRIIVVAVKLTKTMISLSDTSVNDLNPVYLTLDITRLVTNTVCHVLLLSLTVMCASKDNMPIMTIVCLGTFIVLVFAQTVMKTLYVYYDEEKGIFNSKSITLYIVKSAMIILFPLILLILVAQPSIKIFADNLQAISNGNFKLISLTSVTKIIAPIFELFLTFAMIVFFTKNVRLLGYDLCTGNISYYGKSLNENQMNYTFSKSITVSIVWIIIFAVIVLVLNEVYVLFAPSFNKNAIKLVTFALKFLSILLLCIAVKVANKTKVTFRSKIVH